MAKRLNTIPKTSRSKKTAKRLAVKRTMLAAKKAKSATKKKKR